YAYHDLWHQTGNNGQAEISHAAFQRRWAEVASVSSEFAKIIPILLENAVVNVPETKSDANTLRKAWKYKGNTYVMEASLENSEARCYQLGAEPSAQISALVNSAEPAFLMNEPRTAPYQATDPWRWTLTVFGLLPTPRDRSIQDLLAA